MWPEWLMDLYNPQSVYITIVLIGNLGQILTEMHYLTWKDEGWVWECSGRVYDRGCGQGFGWQIWISPASLEHTSDIGDHSQQDYSYVTRHGQSHQAHGKQHFACGCSKLLHLTEGRIAQQKVKALSL